MAEPSYHRKSTFLQITFLYLCSLFLIGIVYLLLLGRLSLRLYSLADGKTSHTNFTATALTIELDPIPATVELPVRVVASPLSATRLHVIPDDCLYSVNINGKALRSPSLPICDYTRGTDLDLSALLKSGENLLLFTVENKSGPGNLRLRPSRAVGPPTVLRLMVVLALLVCSLAYWQVASKRLLLAIFARATDLRWAVAPVSLWIGLVIVGGIILRWCLLPYKGVDINQFLVPWLRFIREQGGFPALAFGFSDYPPAYLYFLVLVHYCSELVNPILLVKLISTAGDLLTAFALYALVRAHQPRAAPLCFAACFLAPTVIMNSSMWGQCDSIYSAFVVLALAALVKNRNNAALLLMGVALSFKLQAIFVVPLFLVLCLSGQFPWSKVLLMPLAFLISLLPAWIAGRPAIELLSVYAGQVGSYSKLSLGAPTIFSWMPNSHFEQLMSAGLVFGMTTIVLLSLSLSWRWRAFTRERIIAVAFLFSVLCPLVLPKMHERYFYLADVLSIAFAAYFPAWILAPVLMQLSSGFSYLPFLLGTTVIRTEFLAFITCGVVAIAAYQTFLLWRNSPNKPARSRG